MTAFASCGHELLDEFLQDPLAFAWYWVDYDKEGNKGEAYGVLCKEHAKKMKAYKKSRLMEDDVK